MHTPIVSVWLALLLALASQGSADQTPSAPPASEPQPTMLAALEPQVFTARFTAKDLLPLFSERVDLLPLPLQFAEQRQAALTALQCVDMGTLVDKIAPFLSENLPGKFDRGRDLIVHPVPPEKRVTLSSDELSSGSYCGPDSEVVGFLLHDIDEDTYVNVAIRILQTARQLLDTGSPTVNRCDDAYYRSAASDELSALLAEQSRRESDRSVRQTARQRLGTLLGIYDEEGNADESKAKWVKESRRFLYVVKDGVFIDKLRPLVEQINGEVELAGISAPTLTDRPGIHFDKDLKDVEILLPRPMLEEFLENADAIEQRMAEAAMITIEVVRLTDRDIVNGAVASRLDVSSRAVHDVRRFDQSSVLKQASINALMAVANRELQMINLREIAAGTVPEGTSPLTLPVIEMPPIATERTATTVGGDFSIGADDIFFDGREQAYGFSYIGPDGLTHTLSLSVVDNLRKLWDRIERNLIVHKIKKTPIKESFSVPVGPHTKTFEGIAALISQENQQLVVATGTGAISELSATAGTWLVIKEFDISPIPGSSTALTDEEVEEINDRTLMTMILRDPLVDSSTKSQLVAIEARKALRQRLRLLESEYADRPLRAGLYARTFGSVLADRRRTTIKEAANEKKERNSKITLTFYSSQGNIITQTSATALGDSNDLTSFTTELTPNMATPISSFFTKLASGTEDSSSLTGAPKGEHEAFEKTMTHLVVRARFPSNERERKDRDEGRHLGYFNLPQSKTPISATNIPLLSSSEHPLQRLSQLRVGAMFPTLDHRQIKKPLGFFNPQRLIGELPQDVWETCTSRMLLNQRIVTVSPTANQSLADSYRQRFDVEVRSLLEYDEDLFDAPNIALRNMKSWNDPNRIVLALRNSAEKFALKQLISMIDELGEILVPQSFADDFLAAAPTSLFGRHHLRPLEDHEVQAVRRDVAAHFLRSEEIYGDAFLEAICVILGLPTYTSLDLDAVTVGSLRGYRNLVLFDTSCEAFADNGDSQSAHELFMLLREGGTPGRLFHPSFEFIEDLDERDRRYLIRGTEILRHRESSTSAKTP